MLLHQGGFQSVPFNTDTINTCTGFSGDVTDIVNRTTKAVDVFITGHTHAAYNCVIDGRPVTSASSYGRLVTDLELTLGAARRHQGRRAPTTADLRRRTSRRQAERARRSSTATTRCRRRCADAGGQDRARTSRATRDPPTRRRARTGRRPDRRRAARRHRRRRPRSAVGALMNPGGVRADFILAERQRGRRGRHLRGGVHGPAVQQHRRHPDVHGGADAGRAQGPVVRDEHVADGPAAVEHVHYTFSSVGRRRASSASRAPARRTRSAT